MEVNALNVNVSVVNNYTATTAAVNEEPAAAVNPAVETEETQQNEAAIYESSDKANQNYTPDMNRVRQLMAESEKQVESFRKLVEGLFNKQAQKADDAFGWLKNANQTDSMKEETLIAIDDETRAAALKEVEEGGYYSVDETAKRLLDFAVALSGGDPSKISALKEAVSDGFKEAEKVWGGELPEISQKTYDAVMKGFDEWEEAGTSEAITLLNKSAAAAVTEL